MTSHEQLNVNNTYNSMIVAHATTPTVAIYGMYGYQLNEQLSLHHSIYPAPRQPRSAKPTCHITATRIGTRPPPPLLKGNFLSGFTIFSGPSLGKIGAAASICSLPRGDATGTE